MADAWTIWLLVVGLAAGLGVALVLLLRLPRAEDDLSQDERRSEAAWIARAIAARGGSVPPALVEDVLELHGAYLRTARPAAPPRGTLGPPPVYLAAPPGPPTGPLPPQQPRPPSAR
jgi:hypothetical protein